MGGKKKDKKQFRATEDKLLKLWKRDSVVAGRVFLNNPCYQKGARKL